MTNDNYDITFHHDLWGLFLLLLGVGVALLEFDNEDWTGLDG